MSATASSAAGPGHERQAGAGCLVRLRRGRRGGRCRRGWLASAAELPISPTARRGRRNATGARSTRAATIPTRPRRRRLKLRFAPAPTGLLHVGNARHGAGQLAVRPPARRPFLLRIDDTDRELRAPSWRRRSARICAGSGSTGTRLPPVGPARPLCRSRRTAEGSRPAVSVLRERGGTARQARPAPPPRPSRRSMTARC